MNICQTGEKQKEELKIKTIRQLNGHLLQVTHDLSTSPGKIQKKNNTGTKLQKQQTLRGLHNLIPGNLKCPALIKEEA